MPKKSQTKIKCPYCKKSIALDEVLKGSIEKEITKKLEEEYQSKLDDSENELEEKEKELELLKKAQKKEIEEILKKEKASILKEAIKKAEETSNKEMKDLQLQLEEKEKKLNEAEEQELKLRKEKRELDEAKKKFELEMQRKMDEERNKIYDDAVKKAYEQHDLKDKEKQKQLDDAKKQIDDLKRRMEQGSQQLQGEILEEEIENLLKETFIQDEIEPIAKGVNGADVIQKVCLRSGKVCGSIIFESKRAKNWSNSWISKLKEDQRDKKADIAVLVTTIMPQNTKDIEYRENIIIVDYKLIIPITFILRNQLVELSKIKNSNISKNEKIETLYSYLTSPEFRQRVESMVESFGSMAEDLNKEKRAMTKIWAKREVQIGKALNGIVGMYGGMQGIIGNSMPDIKALEMDDEDEDDDDKQKKKKSGDLELPEF
jgi:hypothetical protein